MRTNECSVAIDIGTTSVKAIAVDEAGREVARAEERLETQVAADGAAEQDPEEVLTRVRRVLAAVVQAAQATGRPVARVAFSSAMHSLLAVAADGRPLTRAMTWMDARAADDAAALWDTGCGRDIYRATGAPIHAMTPLSKLMWLQRAQPGVHQRAARFVSLKEWVWWHAFGEWCIDAAMAGATGLLDVASGAWHAPALALAGVTPARLSRVVPTTYTRPVPDDGWLREAGLTPGTPVTIGASDGVLANLGAGVVDASVMVLTVGTSGAVRTGASRPVADESARLFSYPLAPGRWVVGAPTNSGGVVIDWLYQGWAALWQAACDGPAQGSVAAGTAGAVTGDGAAGTAAADGFARLLAAAAKASDPALFCLPYVTGERAPLWDARARAAWIGLRLHHTPAHWMRAGVEGILFNLYWIATRVMAGAGRPEVVILSGKLFRTGWVVQWTADLFGIPVQVQADVDASLLGAVALAHVATGAWTWAEAAERGRATVDAAVVRPDPEAHAALAARFARFQALVQALAGEG
ncbi:gluconate kinase [Alicyclobacillus cellulosilyticus]|uniref:Gluconate kinase n=1 Tax=Alicyclobacillus cellulosilyticus TaxID=1003997 RepID=A0A917NJM1_9BACL|nr:gluconokinase [Alicyclobacillus cellulosilyticus]GGJ05424.1 gluconate kinase [Alicyclobacillus cellulosilyticus]